MTSMNTSKIFLIGLMGSGKSTIGRLLAEKMGKNFFDVDDEIVLRNGVDIKTIFEIEGESGFRDREQSVIEDLVTKEDTVLATGGGSILRLANRLAFAENGLIVYLEASPKTLYTRTKKDNKRPLLQHKNPQFVLQTLYHKRHPIYSGLADKTIYTTNKSSSIKVVSEIYNFIKQYENT